MLQRYVELYGEKHHTDVYGEVFSRIKPNLPHVKTFKEWQRGYIPSVEDAIGNIPKRAKESRQYPTTYTDNKGNHPSENLLSAMLNSLTCFGRKPDACSDKYRSRKLINIQDLRMY